MAAAVIEAAGRRRGCCHGRCRRGRRRGVAGESLPWTKSRGDELPGRRWGQTLWSRPQGIGAIDAMDAAAGAQRLTPGWGPLLRTTLRGACGNAAVFDVVGCWWLRCRGRRCRPVVPLPWLTSRGAGGAANIDEAAGRRGGKPPWSRPRGHPAVRCRERYRGASTSNRCGQDYGVLAGPLRCRGRGCGGCW